MNNPFTFEAEPFEYGHMPAHRRCGSEFEDETNYTPWHTHAGATALFEAEAEEAESGPAPSTQCATPALDSIPLLNPKVVACLTVEVPVQRVKWLLDYSRASSGPNWVKQLGVDIATKVPRVKVTVELFRVIPVRPDDPRVAREMKKYMEARGILYYSSWLAELNFRKKIEAELKISLASLYQAAGVDKALPAEEYRSHFVFVYATFPDVKMYLKPVGNYVLSEFYFDRPTVNEYASGRATLRGFHIPIINRMASDIIDSWWTNKKVTAIHVRGHTDDRGSNDYNYALGERRARTVERYLKAAIVKLAPRAMLPALKKINFSVASLSKDEPVSKTNSALNRRVEVIFDYTVQKPVPALRVHDVALRLLKALRSQRTLDPDTAKRLICLAEKMRSPAIDDRYFMGQNVLDIDRTNKPIDPTQWPRIRYSLVNPQFFGPQVSDADLVKNLQKLDTQMLEGLDTLRRRIVYYSGIPMTGALSTVKAFRTFDAWLQKQYKNANSIYNCH